ncbi:hypothetical protein TNIN_302901 [Trichonephila inaurata madagascariensis]|uniref:Uncharacterized protein n=1 Tax=Trichonephila inaurata madagascariensis TaxID=2747483 RepID=A0A8X7BUV6_9ARAC|nr:hypothetical protein TNIN_302901 [Trichonephila inaurata madagascariensis]
MCPVVCGYIKPMALERIPPERAIAWKFCLIHPGSPTRWLVVLISLSNAARCEVNNESSCRKIFDFKRSGSERCRGRG